MKILVTEIAEKCAKPKIFEIDCLKDKKLRILSVNGAIDSTFTVDKALYDEQAQELELYSKSGKITTLDYSETHNAFSVSTNYVVIITV